MSESEQVITFADAAKLVKRTLSTPKVGRDKQPVLDSSNNIVMVQLEVDVEADDVLDVVVHENNTLTVITKDGLKLRASLPAAK